MISKIEAFYDKKQNEAKEKKAKEFEQILDDDIYKHGKEFDVELPVLISMQIIRELKKLTIGK